MPALLTVTRLTTVFDLPGGPVPAVNDVSFEVRDGETVALVGESGSGKTLTALSLMRLVPAPGRISGGSILFQGRNLLDLDEDAMRAVRGAGLSMVFQEPSTALNPVFTVGSQVAEPLIVHGRADRTAARRQAIEWLEAVHLPDAVSRVDDYPHQFSGGQRQRVMLAAALACRPSLLIADEPTTALDATIQADILDLLAELKARYQLSLLVITHDFGVVARTADRVAVMYAGRIVEQGPVRAMLHEPRHPYTRALLASIPGGPRGSRLRAIEGTVPSPGTMPAGCAFAPRCPDRLEACASVLPNDHPVSPGHTVRCHLYVELVGSAPGPTVAPSR